jgi:hypothetical protein
VEDQAIKRCHRLGQQHKVIAKRFYCSGTIEERILTILAKKRRIFSDVIDENRPTVSLGLSEEEIFSLFKGLTVRPRRSTQANAPTRVVLDKTWWPRSTRRSATTSKSLEEATMEA